MPCFFYVRSLDDANAKGRTASEQGRTCDWDHRALITDAEKEKYRAWREKGPKKTSKVTEDVPKVGGEAAPAVEVTSDEF